VGFSAVVALDGRFDAQETKKSLGNLKSILEAKTSNGPTTQLLNQKGDFYG